MLSPSEMIDRKRILVTSRQDRGLICWLQQTEELQRACIHARPAPVRPMFGQMCAGPQQRVKLESNRIHKLSNQVCITRKLAGRRARTDARSKLDRRIKNGEKRREKTDYETDTHRDSETNSLFDQEYDTFEGHQLTTWRLCRTALHRCGTAFFCSCSDDGSQKASGAGPVCATWRFLAWQKICAHVVVCPLP